MTRDYFVCAFSIALRDPELRRAVLDAFLGHFEPKPETARLSARVIPIISGIALRDPELRRARIRARKRRQQHGKA